MSDKLLKVLLINAPVLGVLEPWYDSPDFGRPSLAYLAAYLRKYENCSIQIIDAKLEKLSFDEVLKRAISFNPDVAGFTAFTNEIKPCAYQAALIKKNIAGVVTVVGGPHVTAIPTETLHEFPSFDIGVVGDGEITFLELCRAIKEKKTLSDIDGLVYREEVSNEIKLNAFRTRIPDMDSVPFPAWDLFPRANAYFVQASRGCPFKCVFCMNHNGRIARTRSVGNVAEEIKWIMDTYKPEWIRFGDELWSIDMERSAELLTELIKIDFGKKVKWDMTTHVKYVDKRLFTLLREANVTMIEMGVETGDDMALKRMGKATNRQMIIDAFKLAKDEGVPTGALLLLGQPYETYQSIKNTIDLAVEINADMPLLGIMVPFPGTEVSKMAAEEQGGYKLLSTDWDDYNKHPGNALEFTQISRTKLEAMQLWGYLNIFIRNWRIKDMLKFLFTYRGAAFATIRKMLTPGRKIADMRELPADYDEMIGARSKVSKAELVEAQTNWYKVQASEIKKYNQRIVKESVN